MKLISLLLISLSQIAATPLNSSNLSKLGEECNGTKPACEAGLFCEPDDKKDKKECPTIANPGVCKQICKKHKDCKEKDNICESYSGKKKDCPGLDKNMELCVKGPKDMCQKDKDCKKDEICEDKKHDVGVCKKVKDQ